MTNTLTYDQLNVGDEIPMVVKNVTQEKINRYADASGDHNPLHIDPEFAKTTTYSGTIAHGMLSVAYISEMMTQTFGRAWLAGGKLEINFLLPVRPGDTVMAKGKIAEKTAEDGQQSVRCDVWVENSKGDKVIVGWASALCQ
ncbi:MAG: acyl dehydratase [Chloroflexota bacterium]|nr:MAG: acyl dehydratase [Chloroflexota bacterium]